MSSNILTARASIPPPIRTFAILGYLLVLLGVIAMALLGWLWQLARLALPELDGSIRVRGISAPVSVTRD
ncbi:MAG: hypothetical protein JO356_13810, partial [Acidobacteria bacterium]|nr:hypothetical protein [Acidobacteriota bacterium]